ncbi:MAG: protein sphX [Flavobacteriaceae bacterium]|nr:MAG: protein sphX [Flavobacteriaceae bacterium]
MRKKSILLLLSASIMALVVSCKGKTENQNAKTNDAIEGTIEIDGSSTVAPITEAVAEEFEAIAPNVGVNVGISGTGGGFKKFTKGEIAIADASRAIKEEEAATAKENKIEYVELEVAFDGLAVVVNKENTFAKDLTVEELKKIWEPAAEGKITKWSQVRAGFPDEEIKLYGAGTDSGTYDYFTEAIIDPEKGAPKSRSDFNASEDDNILVEGVAGDKFALGFFGLAYFEENKDKLNLVAINGGKGAVLPTIENVKNGSYAPLSRPLFIYVNSEAAKKPEVIEFVNFYLDKAAELSAEAGYIPLPTEKYQEQKAKFSAFIK